MVLRQFDVKIRFEIFVLKTELTKKIVKSQFVNKVMVFDMSISRIIFQFLTHVTRSDLFIECNVYPEIPVCLGFQV